MASFKAEGYIRKMPHERQLKIKTMTQREKDVHLLAIQEILHG